MFCTINYIETKKRFSKNYKIKIEKIGEVEYYNVTIFKKTAIKKIEKKLNDKVDFAIISDNLKEIEFEKFNIYNNNEFLNNIAEYTFKMIIKLSGIEINELSISIVDTECKHPEFVRSLVRKASILKVATNSIDKYLTVSEGILNDFGTSLVISSTVNSGDIGIIFGETPKIWFKSYENIYSINKNCVKIGVGLRRFVPQGINECDFAGLLQRYNDFKRLKLLNATTLCRNGKYFVINEYNIKNFLDI